MQLKIHSSFPDQVLQELIAMAKEVKDDLVKAEEMNLNNSEKAFYHP